MAAPVWHGHSEGEGTRTPNSVQSFTPDNLQSDSHFQKDLEYFRQHCLAWWVGCESPAAFAQVFDAGWSSGATRKLTILRRRLSFVRDDSDAAPFALVACPLRGEESVLGIRLPFTLNTSKGVRHKLGGRARAKVSPSQLESIKRILAGATRLSASELAEFVLTQSGADEVVLREVRSLLDVQAEARDFHDTPLPELLGAQDRIFSPPLPPGTLLKGRYRIQELLAEGGFATVYMAYDETLAGKSVVVKLLDRGYDAASFRESFAAELQSLSKLNYPNVAGLTDVGEHAGGIPFLVMSHVPGETLRHILRLGRITPERRRRLRIALRASAIVRFSRRCSITASAERSFAGYG